MSLFPAALLAAATDRLACAGVPSPAADARILLMHVSGLSITGLLLATELDESVRARFDRLVESRCGGVPVQHLTGRAWFRNVELKVGPGVFVPRPETEMVAGAAIVEAQRVGSALVVELCAGSGAISAALLDEAPGVQIVAVEREAAAASWLRQNLPESAEVIQADMADTPARLNGRVDVVVANPPYLAWSDRDGLPVDVRDHDPVAALFADDNGMAAIEVVVVVAQRLLRPDGMVIIEHGDDQSREVVALLRRAGFTGANAHADLTGRARFVTARAGTQPVGSEPRTMSGWDGE